MTDAKETEESEDKIPQYVEIPGKETLVVTASDIRDMVEDDRPLKFTADEQRLRYVVDVEIVDELCARDGCDDVPIFESTSGTEYCSPGCMEADS